MQGVLIEKPYSFVPPYRANWWQRFLLNVGIHKRVNRKREGVVEYELHNADILKQAYQDGHGILIAPNHPRTADPATISELARTAGCPFFMMASWHLFNQNLMTTFVIRSMGAFSVNREGLDRKAVDHAIEILQTAERPLVIFAEGTTSRTNDRLMALMEGPSFIARTAAKRREKLNGGKVLAIPVAIKYLYSGDLPKACDEVLTDIETKLTWRPQKHLGLIERIVKVGNAMLTLKEMQYCAQATEGLSLRERQTRMVDHLLDPLESEWMGSPQDGGVQIRIKNLRMKIFPDLSRDEIEESEKSRRWQQLEDTYLAQQIDCYPENYVVEHPSIDRLLETVEKLEEDLTDKARIHGQLKAVIDVCEPLEVSSKRDKSASEDPLMAGIRDRLNSKLMELQTRSPMYLTKE